MLARHSGIGIDLPDQMRAVWDLGLALASLLSMLAVCLRQLGIVRHLPDPPLPASAPTA